MREYLDAYSGGVRDSLQSLSSGGEQGITRAQVDLLDSPAASEDAVKLFNDPAISVGTNDGWVIAPLPILPVGKLGLSVQRQLKMVPGDN